MLSLPAASERRMGSRPRIVAIVGNGLAIDFACHFGLMPCLDPSEFLAWDWSNLDTLIPQRYERFLAEARQIKASAPILRSFEVIQSILDRSIFPREKMLEAIDTSKKRAPRSGDVVILDFLRNYVVQSNDERQLADIGLKIVQASTTVADALRRIIPSIRPCCRCISMISTLHHKYRYRRAVTQRI